MKKVNNGQSTSKKFSLVSRTYDKEHKRQAITTDVDKYAEKTKKISAQTCKNGTLLITGDSIRTR